MSQGPRQEMYTKKAVRSIKFCKQRGPCTTEIPKLISKGTEVCSIYQTCLYISELEFFKIIYFLRQ